MLRLECGLGACPMVQMNPRLREMMRGTMLMRLAGAV